MNDLPLMLKLTSPTHFDQIDQSFANYQHHAYATLIGMISHKKLLKIFWSKAQFCFKKFQQPLYFGLQGISSQTEGKTDISNILWHLFSRKFRPIFGEDWT